MESRNALQTLIKCLHPSPAGIIVGGAFDNTQKQEIQAVAKDHNLQFVAVPYMYMRDHTPEELLEWCSNALMKEFGIE